MEVEPVVRHKYDEAWAEYQDGCVEQVEDASSSGLLCFSQDFLAVDECQVWATAREHSKDEHQRVDNVHIPSEEHNDYVT